MGLSNRNQGILKIEMILSLYYVAAHLTLKLIVKIETATLAVGKSLNRKLQVKIVSKVNCFCISQDKFD